MQVSDLTNYQKRRFESSCTCRICKQKISSTESFELLKTKVGKSMHYSFFHTRCVNEENYGNQHICLVN